MSWKCKFCGFETNKPVQEPVHCPCGASGIYEGMQMACIHRREKIESSCGCSVSWCDRYEQVAVLLPPPDDLVTITIDGARKELRDTGYRCCQGCESFTVGVKEPQKKCKVCQAPATRICSEHSPFGMCGEDLCEQCQCPYHHIAAKPARAYGKKSFRYAGEPVRFITSAQFQEDIKLLAGKIPPDITAIAGVARSWLSAATMISMYLHLPMITIRQTLKDIVPTGNGWRLGSRHVDPKGKILVVDDTIMTGNSLRKIVPLVERELSNAMYAAVYVNPNASRKPDIWAVDLPWPHLLEWNIFNSILSPSMAVDFDGVLCRDCPPGADDDGPRYLEFIRTAQPLYVPRRCPVPLIVTARLERYRAETEDWLRRHGIAWHRLVMHPAASLQERQRDDIAAFKAKHYRDWAGKHRASPGPIIFCESEDWQARRIAQLSKLMTICPHTAGVY